VKARRLRSLAGRSHSQSMPYSSGSHWEPLPWSKPVAPRFRVAKPAKIDHGRDKISCVARDISATGAALEILGVVRIPTRFTLMIPEDQLKLPCHVVWRSEYRSALRSVDIFAESACARLLSESVKL
jgi:hypothetical protein